MNLGPSFRIFGVLENVLWIPIEFTSLWVIFKCFNKFIWIWKPNSDSLFEFKGLNQIQSNTKFEQNLDEVKSKLNLIEFYLNKPREIAKAQCSTRPRWNPMPQWRTGQRPSCTAQAGALWQPMPTGACLGRVQSACSAQPVCTGARSPQPGRQTWHGAQWCSEASTATRFTAYPSPQFKLYAPTPKAQQRWLERGPHRSSGP
jgi:hypothetical protein